MPMRVNYKAAKMTTLQNSITKGQIISKGLLVSLNSPKKMNERINYQDKFIRLFFGRIRGHQKVLLKLSDLYPTETAKVTRSEHNSSWMQ